MDERKSSRVRRTFTPGFKRDAVRLVVDGGKTPTEVARDLGIARSLLQRWVEQLRASVQPPSSRRRGRSSDAEGVREASKRTIRGLKGEPTRRGRAMLGDASKAIAFDLGISSKTVES